MEQVEKLEPGECAPGEWSESLTRLDVASLIVKRRNARAKKFVKGGEFAAIVRAEP